MWRDCVLGDIVDLQRGYDLPEGQRSPGAIPVIGSNGRNGWHDTARADGPGVTVGRSGASAGVVTYVPERYWPHNTVLFVTDFKGNNPRFIAYLLSTLNLANFNSGSAQPSLNRNFLYPQKVRIPLVEQQCKIAETLGSYDDLIENNMRRIAILEEMARRIFEEWFVHFRAPGCESLPLVGSPLGPIPQGWEVASVGDVAQYVNRGMAPKYANNGPSLVINQKCIRGQVLSLEPARQQEKTIPQEKLVRPLDVLINSTGVGTLGRVAQANDVPNNCTVDSHVTIVRPSCDVDPIFFGISLLNLEPVFTAAGVGSTGQTELQRDRIRAAPFIRPRLELQRRYGNTAQPMRQLMNTLSQQNRNLRAQRDLLLPKLISGEIDVSAIPASLKEAAE